MNTLGWKNPRLKFLSQGRTITIDLPQTGENGLVETISEHYIKHEFTDFSINKEIYGYQLNWLLSYDNFADKELLFKLEQMLRLTKSGIYKMILIPRTDTPQRSFEVIYTGDGISQKVKKGGIDSIGHWGINLSFQTKYLIEDWNLVDPDLISLIVWTHPFLCIPLTA
jgi:hypothetical protein